ncbi:uncharacterized protein LOC143593664 [Bidens hawaiensis]|uniref:uncharacterized protein LOC143593664 n=1 Tax=Bidens hawaiensis TaxID=980011 RepID=UPI00404904E6
MQNEYQGDSKVQTVKLQGLRREFEMIQMKDGEPVADFLSKVMKIVNQKRAYGEVVTDQIVVEKVLRSLPARWDHVVAVIEESKDLSRLSYDQLMGYLQSHEARVNRGGQAQVEEQVLQARKKDNAGLFARGRGRAPSRIRGRGRGRGFGRGRSSVQCYNCNRMGHMSRDFWNEPQVGAVVEGEVDEEEGQAHMALTCDESESESERDEVFMAATDVVSNTTKHIWFLDSGCSNHMIGQRALFKDIDFSTIVNVRMGNGKKI